MDCARVKLVADAPHDKLLAFDARKSLEKRRDLVQTTQYVLKPSKVPWQNTQTMETCVPFGSSSELVTCGIHFSPCGQRWFYLRGGRPSTTWAPTPP